MIFGLNSIILPCSVLELCQFKDFARLLDHPVYYNYNYNYIYILCPLVYAGIVLMQDISQIYIYIFISFYLHYWPVEKFSVVQW